MKKYLAGISLILGAVVSVPAQTPVSVQLENITSVKSFGATGDGQADDTEAIQKAIDYAASLGGGKVYVPDGKYMIKAHVDYDVGTYLYDVGGVALQDNIHLILSDGAMLKALPAPRRAYNILRVVEKNNVIIEGGTIEGERREHLGTGGEWGYGIAIQGGKGITVRGLTAKDCWGDGLNVQVAKHNGRPPEQYCPVDITIDRVRCLCNYRQGLSIEGGFNVRVSNSHFSFTSGTAPSCGIDIEPWSAANTVKGCVIENCVFEENASSGMLVMGAAIDGVEVANCHFLGNKDSEAQFKTWDKCKNITVRGCRFEQKNSEGQRRAIMFSNSENLSAIGNDLINSIFYLRSLKNVPVRNVLIKGNRVALSTPCAGNVVAFNLVDESGSSMFENITFDGNVFDLADYPASGSQRVMLYGKNVVFSNNTLLGVNQGIAVSWAPNIKIENNAIHGSATRAGQIADSPNALFNDNVMSGAGHHSGHASLSVLSGSNGAKITNNQFYQASKIPVSGTRKSSRALSIDPDLTGITLEGNETYPADGSSY